jgi:hypothetical protein
VCFSALLVSPELAQAQFTQQGAEAGRHPAPPGPFTDQGQCVMYFAKQNNIWLSAPHERHSGRIQDVPIRCCHILA